MDAFCLRNEIEKRLPTDDKFTIALILSCCSYCKKIQNRTEVDKYSKLLIEPLWISLKKDEHALMRAIGSNILENTAKLFTASDNEEDEMQYIISAVKKSVSSGSNKYLIDCLSQVSPSTYLRLMARWHFYQISDAAFAMALCFFSAKANICYMAFRTQFIYEDNNEVFFDIGVSLDEGCTEYLTQELMNSSDEDRMADAYYFEVEFYKNIIKQYGIGKREEGKIMFTNGGPLFLYEHTKKADKCSFYDLFQLSDNQDWRKVYQILREIKETTDYGDNM